MDEDQRYEEGLKHCRSCVCCEKEDEQCLNLMPLPGNKQFVCLQCYAEQNQGVVVIMKDGKPTLYPSLDLITEGIWLGNEDSAIDEETIKEHKIRAICACGSFLMTPYSEQKFDIKYMRHDIGDYPSQSIIDLFDENNTWIEEMRKEGRNILIHCAAGVSRSSSFTIAYMMFKERMGFEQAYKLVKERRKIIRPNSGFVKQLKEYESRIIDQRKDDNELKIN